jgi:pimeloyl-ACP methyl ester carboxylesterase
VDERRLTPELETATGPIKDAEYRRCCVGGAEYLFALAGDGEPVLLLHGFPETHYCWRALIPALAESHRIVAPDRRGYGGSRAAAGGASTGCQQPPCERRRRWPPRHRARSLRRFDRPRDRRSRDTTRFGRDPDRDGSGRRGRTKVEHPPPRTARWRSNPRRHAAALDNASRLRARDPPSTSWCGGGWTGRRKRSALRRAT